MYEYEQLTYKDIFKKTAQYIYDGYIVAWYQGRSESGPRALGNRSLLADPRNPNMKDIMNNNVKHREPYRPFAPSVLAEYASDWFENISESKYMTKIFKVKNNKQKYIPAVVHIDNTARIQTVSKEDNKLFYNLIKEFYNLSNVPMVLNTSFNDKGEPIVETPEDAFNTFSKTGINILVLKNFIIRKDHE